MTNTEDKIRLELLNPYVIKCFKCRKEIPYWLNIWYIMRTITDKNGNKRHYNYHKDCTN